MRVARVLGFADPVRHDGGERRAGEKRTVEFWLTIAGRFLHIRYFAVRVADGTYRGIVETVQDVTAVRALEGQRRLLE
jgi:DUF438 domain-containing protein